VPIPVGLPVPSYGKGYGGYGYGGYGGGHHPYQLGLFGGFGGPLSELLREKTKDGDGALGPLLGGGPLTDVGFNPVKASILAGRSSPFIHLLAAPYIKNIRENGGADLPTLNDLQDLLERSSFGLTGLDGFGGNNGNRNSI